MIQVQYSHGTSWHDPTSTSHYASHLSHSDCQSLWPPLPWFKFHSHSDCSVSQWLSVIFESVRVGRDSEPRACRGLHPGPAAAPAASRRLARCSARPLSSGGLGRQGLARCWVAAAWGPRHCRQQFLKQDSEFPRVRRVSWKHLPCLVCGLGAHWQWPPAAAVPVRKRLPGCSLPPSDSDSEPRRRGGRAQRLRLARGGRLGAIIWTHTGSTARRRGAEATQPPCRR
jgi:hypothetical protein